MCIVFVKVINVGTDVCFVFICCEDFFFLLISSLVYFSTFFLSLFGELDDFFSSFVPRAFLSLPRSGNTDKRATTEDIYIYIYIKREELREHLRSKRERVKSKRTTTRREKSVT